MASLLSLVSSVDMALAVAMSLQPPTVADLDWEWHHFFDMTENQVQTVKKQLATACGLNYIDKGADKPMGYDVSGVNGLSRDKLEEKVKAMQTIMADSQKNFETKAKDLCEQCVFATVISGCHVKWATSTTTNRGYIENQCRNFVGNWDTSVERRAGGYDHAARFTAQEFTVSSMSSLMALFAEVVYHLKKVTLTEKLINAFRCIRVTMYMHASRDEIGSLNAAENVAQMKRKVHCELDNVKLVESWMKNMCAFDKLSANQALDVWKYALCQTDPKASQPPAWMVSLLENKSGSLASRIEAIADKDINLNKLTKDWKATTTFDEMTSYAMVNQRVRFLKGFDGQALEKLNSKIFSEMGRRGIAHQKFPLNHGILMSPDLLTSAAFARAKDQEAVPTWRDGALGVAIQNEAIDVFVKRFFDYDFYLNSSKPVFTSAAAWMSFTRIIKFVDGILINDFGPRQGWPDMAHTLDRGLWKGEYDADIVQLSCVFPGSLDGNGHAMMKRLREQFAPLCRMLLAYEESKKVVSVVSGETEAEKEEQKKKAEEEEEQRKKAEEGQKGAVAAISAGDVSSSISEYANMSVFEKKALVTSLNKDAQEARKATLSKEIHLQAAAVWRNRVKILPNATEVKRYMESTGTQVLQMRMGLVDFTMPMELQTGAKSRRLCKEPSESCQKDLVTAVHLVPSVPVVSNILVRCALQSCHAFFGQIEKTHPHRGHFVVPIDVPARHLRYLTSGSSRAAGPDYDTRSGVDFMVRTIGHGGKAQGSTTASTPTKQGGGAALNDEDSDVEALSDGEAPPNPSGESMESGGNTSTMSMRQLLKKYGEEMAQEITQIHFQHSNRICASAHFRDPSSLLKVAKNERSNEQVWRKGQLDASVYYRALESTKNLTNLPIAPGDVFVDFTAGTPESLVAAIALGFKHVFMVCTSVEAMMFTIPTEEEEQLGQIDYTKYVSPDSDNPSAGVLAAEGVRALAQCIQNEIEKSGYMRVEPVRPITLPQIKTYSYFAVTDQIVVRTGMPLAEPVPKAKGKAASKAKGKGQKPPKKEVPDAPKAAGKVDVLDQGSEDDGDDDSGGGDDGDDPNLDEEISALEAEAAAAKAKPKPKGKKRQLGALAKGSAKKKVKGSGTASVAA